MEWERELSRARGIPREWEGLRDPGIRSFVGAVMGVCVLEYVHGLCPYMYLRGCVHMGACVFLCLRDNSSPDSSKRSFDLPKFMEIHLFFSSLC